MIDSRPNIARKFGFRQVYWFVLFLTTFSTFLEAKPLAFISAEAYNTLVQNVNVQDSMITTLSLQGAYEKALQTGDTLQAINKLLELSSLYGHEANYAKSYDVLWETLFLADDIKNNMLRANIYGALGRFYSFYRRKDDALKYLQESLDINKGLVTDGKLDASELVQNYYLFVSTHREFNEPQIAKIFLDSCMLYYKEGQEKVQKSLLHFEEAYVLDAENKTEEALSIMQEIEPWFLANKPSYLVLVYTYWGDMFRGSSDMDKSEALYKKALDISENYRSHIDFTPLIYEKLSDIYYQRKDYRNAYINNRIAKDLDAQFFDSRSRRNNLLLEIRDEYRIEKERQERLIQKQRLEQLEQEDKILLLQQIILISALFFLLILGAVYVKYTRDKHKAEKEIIRRNKELEIQKAKELLELKNKELAASALQLVEKEELFKDLKRKIRESESSIKKSDLNKILRSVYIDNNKTWDEFRYRFIDVNKEFYDKIFEKFPKLSQGDQKICALIKLNMSSKDMARLLGISVESVHTSRHRIRKKMKLPRTINLEEYINSL